MQAAYAGIELRGEKMFLSEMWRKSGSEMDSGSLEMVSLGGETSTVVSSGKQSKRAVFAPGGLAWVPKRGQGVLVVKAGMEDCIAGAETEGLEHMEPGEIRLFSQKASVWLKNDGTIQLEGKVLLNGKELTV